MGLLPHHLLKFLPPPFFLIHTCFFSPLKGSCTIFFLPVIERGTVVGCLQHNRKETHKQIHSFSHKHKKKQCKKKQNKKKTSSFFANRFYLLSWKLFLIYCVRVVRDSHTKQTWLPLIQPP